MVERFEVDLNRKGYQNVQPFHIVGLGLFVADFIDRRLPYRHEWFTVERMCDLSIKHMLMINEFFRRDEYVGPEQVMSSINGVAMLSENQPCFAKVETDKRVFTVFYDKSMSDGGGSVSVATKKKPFVEPKLVYLDLVIAEQTPVVEGSNFPVSKVIQFNGRNTTI